MKRLWKTVMCPLSLHWYDDQSEREYHWLVCTCCGKTISYPRSEK